MDKKPTIAKMFLTGLIPAFFISGFIGQYLLPLGGSDASMGPFIIMILSFLLVAPLIGAIVLSKIKSSTLRAVILIILTLGGLSASYIFENNCNLRIVEGVDKCYKKKAQSFKDISYCDKIKDVFTRDSCRDMVSRDLNAVGHVIKTGNTIK